MIAHDHGAAVRERVASHHALHTRKDVVEKSLDLGDTVGAIHHSRHNAVRADW